ncbi:MAG: DUF3696 domain-containing protein [Leptospiraceae bacterium]|nr:DUF3696 domain-containing protein [Leptospiraceae bacterium]
MNYFHEMYVKNFKCFEESKIPFQMLTILAGINSAGKSSLLQSILLVRSIIDYQKKGNNSPDKLKLNESYLLNLGTNTDVLNDNAGDSRITIEFHFQNKEIKYLFISPEKKEIYLEVENCPKLSDLKNLSLSQDFFYLNAERIGPRKNYDLEVLDFPHSGWRGEHAIQMLIEEENIPDVHKNKSFSRLTGEETENLKFRNEVNRWMSFILSGEVAATARKFENFLNAEIQYNSRKPSNVGFGISYSLPIVVNGLLAKEGSILIVENPEAHLHPSAQSRMGQFLSVIAHSGVQVILETHSEHILNGARIGVMRKLIKPEQVIVNFFTKEIEKLKIQNIEITSTGDLNNFPKGFFDQVQVDMAEIIRLKRKQEKT